MTVVGWQRAASSALHIVCYSLLRGGGGLLFGGCVFVDVETISVTLGVRTCH